ncbi:hypothetical protein D3C86_1987230 [compost metagenome]
MELSLRNNNYWLNYLTSRLKNGEDLGLFAKEKEMIEKVTVESTKATAEKYLNEDNYIRFVLLPQK